MSFRAFFVERQNRFLTWWGIFSVLGLVRMSTDKNFSAIAAVGIVAAAAFLSFCMVGLAWLRTGRKPRE